MSFAPPSAGNGSPTLPNSSRSNGGDGSGDAGGLRAQGIDRTREQVWMITIALHGLYLAFNGLLFMAIQIKYQNRRNSPFETRTVMKISLVALFVYFCAVVLQTALVRTNNKLEDPRLLNHVLVCSGILSALSNALVFLPNMEGRIVVYLFAIATAILLAYDVFKLISNYIRERNNSNTNAAPTSEITTESNNNAAVTSEATEISNENNNNDAAEIMAV